MIPEGMFGNITGNGSLMQQRTDENKTKKNNKAFDNDSKEVVVFDTRNEVKCQQSLWSTGSR